MSLTTPKADRLPWWGACIAGALAIAARYYVPETWLVYLLLVSLMVAGLCVDVLHPKHRTAVLTFSLVAAWVAAANLSRHLLGAWTAAWTGVVIVWLSVVIGWRAFGYRWKRVATFEQKVDARRAIHEIKHHWPKFAHQAGLPDDSKPEDAHPTPTGVALDVVVPGDASALVQKQGTIAAAFGVGKDQVAVVTDPDDAGRAHINLRTIDPLATKPKGWTTPGPDYSIRQGMEVGPSESGRLCAVDFVAEHWQVTGITRSGKTHVLQLAAAHFAYAPDAVLVVIDTVKRGADFTRWEHAALIYAIDPDQAADALQWLYDTMRHRYAKRRTEKRTGQWNPKVEGPQIGVILDEAANACRLTQVQDLLMLLAAESSGAGITLVVGTQSPQHRIFDTNTRRNLGTKIALATDSSQASDLALDQGYAAMGYDCSTLPKGGHCFVKPTGSRAPTRARAWWVEDRELDQAALRLDEAPHIWPHPTLEGPPVQAPPTDPQRAAATHPGPDQTLLDPPTGDADRGMAPVIPLPLDRQGVAPVALADPESARREEACGLGAVADLRGVLLSRCSLQYAERVYDLLLERGPTSRSKVGALVPCTSRTAQRTLDRLATVGLARKAGDLWSAIPPDRLKMPSSLPPP